MRGPGGLDARCSTPHPQGDPLLIQDAFLQVVILTKIDIGLYMGQSLREGEVGSVIIQKLTPSGCPGPA